jgi:hypothetical protein
MRAALRKAASAAAAGKDAVKGSLGVVFAFVDDATAAGSVTFTTAIIAVPAFTMHSIVAQRSTRRRNKALGEVSAESRGHQCCEQREALDRRNKHGQRELRVVVTALVREWWLLTAAAHSAAGAAVVVAAAVVAAG